MTPLLYAMVAVGTLLSGVAAVGQLINRLHIQRLRTEVNGQTHLLVATTHALGVAEGVASQLKAEGLDTNGAPT